MGVVVFFERFPLDCQLLRTASRIMLCGADVFRMRADSWAARQSDSCR